MYELQRRPRPIRGTDILLRKSAKAKSFERVDSHLRILPPNRLGCDSCNRFRRSPSNSIRGRRAGAADWALLARR